MIIIVLQISFTEGEMFETLSEDRTENIDVEEGCVSYTSLCFCAIAAFLMGIKYRTLFHNLHRLFPVFVTVQSCASFLCSKSIQRW